MTLADIIIPLCGSISNERAQKIREACDMQERRVEALEKRVEALSLDVAILVEGTVEAVHEAGLRTLAQRVEALEQIRISHEADYSKSASVLADRIEALDRALSAAAEDNGDLDVRVPALERASEAQGEPPTIEECDAEFRRATVEEATRRLPSIRTEDAVEIHLAGISAVRALCLSRAPSPSPALAAIVEAGDAMQNAGHLLRTSCYQVQVTPEARMWDDALAAYDRARAALPKGGAA